MLTELIEDKSSLALGMLSKQYLEDWRIAELRREFGRNDYVKLPGFLTNAAATFICAEVARLKQYASSKNFIMPGYDTPRMLKTIGGATISCKSPRLESLYSHHEVRQLIEEITGATIYPCLHPNEFMVINYLTFQGATHGWHLDDPAYALVIFTEAPVAEDGGLLEFIRDWPGLTQDGCISADETIESTIEHCRSVGLIKVRSHNAGDAYLLRADQCLHRVTPLKTNLARRVVINLGFEATPTPTYGITASLLYGDN